MENWNSVSELFGHLNRQQTSYVVLRNCEELENIDILHNHGDIDFLCGDLKTFIEVTHAEKRSGPADIVHYTVRIGGGCVPIDVRTVGDDYYDEKWESDMLVRRVMYKDLCFIPQEDDLFYSLCYHAILQKENLSDEYRQKLLVLKPETEGFRESDYVSLISAFFDKNGYRYCYPMDRGVFFRKELIDQRLLKRNCKESLYRTKIAVINRVKSMLLMKER